MGVYLLPMWYVPREEVCEVLRWDRERDKEEKENMDKERDKERLWTCFWSDMYVERFRSV